MQMQKLGRRVQSHQNTCGELQRQAYSKLSSSILLPKKNKQLYGIVVISLLHLAWITSMALLPSTACQAKFLVVATKDPVALYFLYWLPAFVHLFSILISFSWPYKTLWVLSVAFGFTALIWQLVCLIMFFVKPQWSDVTSALTATWAEPVLWWLDMIPLCAIIFGQLDITTTSGGFQSLSQQTIIFFEL